MKNIIKNILKEEYDNIKLKDFIFNYFDKKIDSGEWRWVYNDTKKNYLIDNKYNILLELINDDDSKSLWIFWELYNKFTFEFNINYNLYSHLIEKYLSERYGEKINLKGRSGLTSKKFIKEEYNQGLKKFIYKYINKKLKDYEWEWFYYEGRIGIQNPNTKKRVLMLDRLNDLWIYTELWEKLNDVYSIDDDSIKQFVYDYIKEYLKKDPVHVILSGQE